MASEFVKHGCSEAEIEIELQRYTEGKHATGRNPRVKRIIKRDDNKSYYWVNQTTSNSKGAQQLAKMFNIQIDNLCQFLPQDKVVEFAQMSPIQILESTQKAAAPPAMIQQYNKLKALRIEQKELLNANRGDREHLDSLQRRQEASRAEKERMQEREVAEKKLGWLEKLRPVPQYGKAKKDAENAKAEQKRLTAELKQLHKDAEPALRGVNKKEAYKKAAVSNKEAKSKALALVERRCDRLQKDVEDASNDAEECKGRISAEKNSVKQKKLKVQEARRTLAQLEHQRENKPPEFDWRAMNQEIQELKQQSRDHEERKTEATSQIADLTEQGKARQQKGKAVETSLKNLDTESGQQESRLESLSKDTFLAWQWIKENGDLFEQQVYGPPIVECSLKDAKMADAVESFLQKSDFSIITVQNQRDFNTLQQKLNREKGLHDIRLRTCSDTSLDAFRRPVGEDEMKQLGFSGYAVDFIDGPDTVLAMLCHEKRIHASAIAATDLSDDQHQRAATSGISAYCIKGKMYRFTNRREYGSAGSTAAIKEYGPAQYWTKQTVDLGRKAALQREIAEIRGELETIRAERDNCRNTVTEAENQMKDLAEQIKTITKEKEAKQLALTVWNGLPQKIKQEQEKIEQFDEFMSGVQERVKAASKERGQHLTRKAEVANQFAAILTELQAATTALLEAEIHVIEATSDFSVLKDRNQHIKDTITDKEMQEATARHVASTATEKARGLIRECQQIRQESLRLKQEENDNGFELLLEQIGREQWSSEKLEADIDSQKAQIELSAGGNANVIKEYEERAKAIAKLQERLTTFNEKQEEYRENFKNIRESWETDLEVLVGKISAAFGDSFARIGCAGQVAVYKANSEDPLDCTEENNGRENGLDFANWAIHISVKFRENEPLSILDSHRQSGGERAVSTIFYLMALQSLSRAPFRVVDEINQGMDPRNERMVHGRMVDIATDEGGSQYFLITPKLLNGLKYRSGMTVLCIVSGENVPGETEMDAEGNEVENPRIDFRTLLQKAKMQGLGGRGGKRTDSGIGLGAGGDLGSDFSREGSRLTSVGA